MGKHPLFAAYVALAAVCFFWGTTYLAIRMALETFPPMMLVSVRYALSGGIMLVGAWLARAKLPRGRRLWRTALFGVLVLGVGNGALVMAELLIPSGLAALMITVGPFWMVGLDAILPGGARLHGPTVGAMCAGMLGAALLVAPGARDASAAQATLQGFVILQVGCAGWSFGSLMQRREPPDAHPIVAGAVQQFAAGLAFIVPALMTNAPIRWSTRGAGALVYLVIFGSIVGYSAYIYALDRLPVALVSIYNYVNPVVAVILGWLVYREPFGLREAIAMAVIFAGVAFVKRFSQREVAT